MQRLRQRTDPIPPNIIKNHQMLIGHHTNARTGVMSSEPTRLIITYPIIIAHFLPFFLQLSNEFRIYYNIQYIKTQPFGRVFVWMVSCFLVLDVWHKGHKSRALDSSGKVSLPFGCHTGASTAHHTCVRVYIPS